MRLSGSRAYYRPTPPKMPSGLVELLEGLTREVLKNNPADMYGFCAGYLHQLLEIRDGPLHKKSLTLEEKIARAQEKVRQRAEKRWQQSNFDEHPPQQGGKGTESNNISNKDNLLSPYHHSENIDSEVIKSNDNIDINNEVDVTKYESKNNSNLISLSKPESIIKEDNGLFIQPNAEYDVKEAENGIFSEITILGLEPVPHEQALNDENLHFEESQSAEQNLSSQVNSMLVNQHCDLIDDVEKIIENIAQVGAIKGANVELDEQKSVKHTDVIMNDDVDDVIESKSERVELSNTTEAKLIKTINDNTQIIQQYREYVELSNDNIIVNENMENKTVDISFTQSSVVELQDPSDNSIKLESLLEVTSDGDVLTLLTQESNNDDRKEIIVLDNDSLNSEEFDKLIMSVSNSEVSDNNTECLNKTNTGEVNENSVVSTNNLKKRNGESDIICDSTKLIEDFENSQDGSNIMDLETAAITIQKVFRTFLFKSRASTFDEVTDEAIFFNEAEKSKENCNFANQSSLNERRSHGITRMDTVLQTVNEEKSLSLSTDDSSTLSSAATVIQAHVRGFLARNKQNSNKTLSNISLAASYSNELSVTSLEKDNDQNKNKTVLNIHIVPDGGNYLSRDESLITSMDLSLDSSPPSSINLHPLGYDKSERRKQLKREDAIQSISPPSTHSGKLSEDFDSVKEMPLNDQDVKDNSQEGISLENTTFETTADSHEVSVDVTDNRELTQPKRGSLSKVSSDEMDVVTPFTSNEDNNSSAIKLMHSGEFHDAVLPTKVLRGDTSVASGE